MLWIELAQAVAYYRASAQRQAQLEYLIGMLMAIIPAAIITAIVAVTAGLLDTPAMVAVLAVMTFWPADVEKLPEAVPAEAEVAE